MRPTHKYTKYFVRVFISNESGAELKKEPVRNITVSSRKFSDVKVGKAPRKKNVYVYVVYLYRKIDVQTWEREKCRT